MKYVLSRLAIAAGLLMIQPGVRAADAILALPPVLAESEVFELVGRLEDEGFVFYIDRADSNTPVLGARLEIEGDGQVAKASFRAERGDYLVADAAWLQTLRQPGEHLLAITLLVGDESDLLSAAFSVPVAPAKIGGMTGLNTWAGWLTGLALLGGLLWRRFRKGGRA